MARQSTNTAPAAVMQAGTDRDDFLHGRDASGYECSSPTLGREVETSVCVFHESSAPQSLMLVQRSGAFAMHNILTPTEARTLAAALLLAADHAENQALDHDIAVAMEALEGAA